MRRARASLLAAGELIAGDDWRTTFGVALALAVTALLTRAGIAAWWVMPVAVLGLLTWSVRRAAGDRTRRRRR